MPPAAWPPGAPQRPPQSAPVRLLARVLRVTLTGGLLFTAALLPLAAVLPRVLPP